MSSIITTSLDYCAISSEGHGLLPLGKNTKTAEYYLKLQSAIYHYDQMNPTLWYMAHEEPVTVSRHSVTRSAHAHLTVELS